MRRTACLITLAVLVLSAPASAQEGPLAQSQIFFSPSGEVFRNKTPEPYPVTAWFTKADQDTTGTLTKDEFINDAKRYFAVLDEDANGSISSKENSRYENELAPEILAYMPLISQPSRRMTDADGKRLENQPYQRQITGATQFGLINEPQPVRGADSNFDFKITASEWNAASTARFKLLDRNQDGTLSLAELPQTPIQTALMRQAEGKGKKQRNTR